MQGANPPLDFTPYPQDKTKFYDGANGNKIAIFFNNARYMLKFPPKVKPTKNLEMTYTHACFCEYIACHIIKSLGLRVQETMLGTYLDKVVVACKDFTSDTEIFVDFLSVKNGILALESGGKDTTLSGVLLAIEQQGIVENTALKAHFWEMFIADTLIGNFDRHNGNWGFIKDLSTHSYSIAPIFDCGSCLYPQSDAAHMQQTLSDKQELNARIYSYPCSMLKDDHDKKLNYHNFLTTTENKDCLNTLVKLAPKMDMIKIHSTIDNTPFISNLHKDFLKVVLTHRKEKIIDKAYARALTLL
ncbi:HipA_C domain-containing protein [Helicobacter sp. NHP21005]|uniref:HipA domain-containing protein n=1 Tax=Helicobacter felistomachi TaxID=3040201 RepID=UPI0025724398|nr:HipA domain-containing protein [Helicobacter sp. NHP21005]BEG57326.1 HipA_C domain-containing protein [Helicobacter sp. NHP21005]